MSKDNVIKMDHNVLDFDECISKTVLLRNTVHSVVSKSTEHFETSGFEHSIRNAVQTNSCKNLDEHVTKENAEQGDGLQFDLVLITSNNTNNLCNNEENKPKDIENNIKFNDVISISSEEDLSLCFIENIELLNTISPKFIKVDNSDGYNDQNYDSDCSGYHSSDFEFITESEAEIEGLINNRAKELHNRTPFSKNLSETSTYSDFFNCLSTHYSVPGGRCSDTFKENNQPTRNSDKDLGLPNKIDLEEAGPSCSNIATNNLHAHSLGPSSSYSKFRYNEARRNALAPTSPPKIFLNDNPVHNAIPAGEEYFNLFRGIYDPMLPLCSIHMMENKSFRATGMNVEFEGIGFDLRLMRNMDGSSQDELESEAEENVKKIINLYPGDNRKRRRH